MTSPRRTPAVPESRTARGARGGALAARLRARHGYRVLERNYRTRAGEIDLVCRHGSCLVFVEVRTASGAGYGHPVESLTAAKRNRLWRTGLHYLTYRRPPQAMTRFDLVAIEMGSDGSLERYQIVENILDS
ncbi:MAG: YraN family protein [Candidatus Riflebacteria bacterium]|nr:YraN family protein [Candidatus Riflebacteria bacterium]